MHCCVQLETEKIVSITKNIDKIGFLIVCGQLEFNIGHVKTFDFNHTCFPRGTCIFS